MTHAAVPSLEWFGRAEFLNLAPIAGLPKTSAVVVIAKAERMRSCELTEQRTEAELHNEVVEMLEELNVPLAFETFEEEIPTPPFALFSLNKPQHRNVQKNRSYTVILCCGERQEEIKKKLMHALDRYHYVVCPVWSHDIEGKSPIRFGIAATQGRSFEGNCALKEELS